MKQISVFLSAALVLLLGSCGGKSEQVAPQKDSVPVEDYFIGETGQEANPADSLIFESLPDAVASIAGDEDVVGVWSHDVAGEAQYYYLIYRADGMNWLRNVYVEGGKYRLADEKQSIQLKRINVVEFADMQNGGGYRLTDSTLVVYDAQNYAEELGRRVFDWKD